MQTALHSTLLLQMVFDLLKKHKDALDVNADINKLISAFFTRPLKYSICHSTQQILKASQMGCQIDYTRNDDLMYFNFNDGQNFSVALNHDFTEDFYTKTVREQSKILMDLMDTLQGEVK
jgi:hypothetical protein